MEKLVAYIFRISVVQESHSSDWLTLFNDTVSITIIIQIVEKYRMIYVSSDRFWGSVLSCSDNTEKITQYFRTVGKAVESYRLAPECKFRASPLYLLQGHKPPFSCRKLLTLLKRTCVYASFWPRHVFRHFTWFSKLTAFYCLNNINRLFFVMKANVFSLRWKWFSLLKLIYTSVKVQRARTLKISALQSVDRSISDPATFLYYAFRYSFAIGY